MRHQRFFKPAIHHKMIAGSFKQHRRKKLFAALRHDEIDIFAIIPRYVAVYFFSPGRPSVGTVRMFPEACFIDVDDVIVIPNNNRTCYAEA